MTKNRQGNSVSFWSAGMTTIASITLVLLLLGLTILVGFMGQRLTSFIKENLAITIELPDKIKESEISKLEKQLKESFFAKEVKFIDKEEIKKQLISDLGKDPEEILGYNPASNCFEIRLNSEYANSDSIKVIEESLKSRNITQNILYSQDDLDIVNANLSKIGTALFVLAIVLMFISFTLIRNIIRLNIYSRRFTINTMQLVGATNSFIRKPFLKQMVTCGIISAILANALITIIIYSFVKEYADFLSLVNLRDVLMLYAIVLVLGVILTIFATCFAVNKYLKMKTGNLYYI